MEEVLRAILEAIDSGETIAVLTVVRAAGSTPRHLASKMLVRTDGTFVGSIGGGTMERQAIEDARAVIRAGVPRLLDYNLTGKTPGSVGLCGGTEQVFVEVMTPAAKN